MAMSDLSKAGIIFKQGLTIASKTTVADLEKACGATFSDDYKEFLENVNGARIALKDSDAKRVPSANINWVSANFLHQAQEFVGVDYIYDKDTALKVYRNMRHYPIGQVFPVAAANNNTCFVMSLNEKDKGTIKVVRVYTEGSHNIMGSVIVCTSLPIAKNVTDFFLSLKSVKRS